MGLQQKAKKRFILKYGGEGRLEQMERIHTRRRKDGWGEEAYWGKRRRRGVLVQLCLVRPTGMNCLQGAWPWLRDADTPPFNPWHTHTYAQIYPTYVVWDRLSSSKCSLSCSSCLSILSVFCIALSVFLFSLSAPSLSLSSGKAREGFDNANLYLHVVCAAHNDVPRLPRHLLTPPPGSP